jgi:hypothetical protein
VTSAPDCLSLLAIDPQRVLVTWRLAPRAKLHLLRTLQSDAAHARFVVELTDATGATLLAEPPAHVGELSLAARPDTSYVARVGLLLASGRFLPLLASAPASTPSSAPHATNPAQWVQARMPNVIVPAPHTRGPYDIGIDGPPGSAPTSPR